MASQDAAALIASNNPFWSYIGNAGSGMIKALATSANKFMSMLVDNRSFLNMVKSLENDDRQDGRQKAPRWSISS